MRIELEDIFILWNPRAGRRGLRGLTQDILDGLKALGQERDFPSPNMFPAEVLDFHLHFYAPEKEGQASEDRPYKTLTLLRTESSEDCHRYASAIVKNYGERALIVLCGGDGTINSILRALKGQATPVFILPYGSGNDLVRSLYPQGQQKVAKILERMGLLEREGRGHRLAIRPEQVYTYLDRVFEDFYADLIQMDTEAGRVYSLNAISAGLDSDIADRASKLLRRVPSLQKLAYMLAIIPALMQRMVWRLELRGKGRACDDLHAPGPAAADLEGEELRVDLDYSLAALCNARYYGGGFMPAPGADLQDGIAELAISKPLGRLRLASLIRAYREGRAGTYLRSYQMTEGELRILEGREKLCLSYDGEICWSSWLRFRVLPGAIRLAVPRAFRRGLTEQ